MRPAHGVHIRYNRLAKIPSAQVEVGLPFAEGDPPPATVAFQGVWDTGATDSVITKKVVDALNLKPVGVTKVFHAQGSAMADTFLVSIKLPDSAHFNSLRVTLGDLAAPTGVLIGMDVILKGDFCLTNEGGLTKLTFIYPSRGIDELHRAVRRFEKGLVGSAKTFDSASGLALPTTVSATPTVGRNDPCPCGSKKKFKKCHGGPNPPPTPLPAVPAT